jgi:methylated-DNA-[protein]-cysteine S-methyltransferase
MTMMTPDIESTLSDAAGRLADGGADAGARLADAAAATGLLDVAYAEVESPVGALVAAATPRGLVRLAYADDGIDSVLEELARRVSPRLLEAPARLDDTRRELDEYFAGRRRRFDVLLDLSLTRGFGRRVLVQTARVPFGEVSTYAEIAARAGSPRGSRAAGNALGANPIPIIVPCHRVVRSGGGLGGYTGGLHRKEALLAVEGATS